MNEKTNQYFDVNYYYIKVMSFCVCIIIDIIVNSITQFLGFGDELTNFYVYNTVPRYQDSYEDDDSIPDFGTCRKDDKYMCWIFVFLQGSFIIIMIFITLSIISETFYFKQGLIGTIVKKFRYAFGVDLLYLALFLVERLIFGLYLMDNDKEHDKNAIKIWKKWYYIIFYVLKYVGAFLFYIFNLDMLLELGKSVYYKKDFSVIPKI
jgi:hypothetical protein